MSSFFRKIFFLFSHLFVNLKRVLILFNMTLLSGLLLHKFNNSFVSIYQLSTRFLKYFFLGGYFSGHSAVSFKKVFNLVDWIEGLIPSYVHAYCIFPTIQWMSEVLSKRTARWVSLDAALETYKDFLRKVTASVVTEFIAASFSPL